MDRFPQNLIEQYLKVSMKLKKIERFVFKRFAPNVSEVLYEFSCLAKSFEDAEIYQYAAMCHLGVAKCENSSGNTINECQAYLKAARLFRFAMSFSENLAFRSNQKQYADGALRCYTKAVQCCPDDILHCAIIREMNSHCESTSSFSSPGHRIYELEFLAHECLQKNNFLEALQYLEELTDDINERKKQSLYEELLERVEILRMLLLIALDLPPTRQSPSHIKLIEFYYHMGNFELLDESTNLNFSNSSTSRAQLPLNVQYVLGEIVVLWSEHKLSDLKIVLERFAMEFKSLNEAQRFVKRSICDNINQN